MSSFSGFSAQARTVLILGLPLIGSHVAQFALHIVDTVMLGWYGVTDLAAGALGATIFFVTFTLGMGFAQAVMPMVATAAVAGDDTEVRRVTRMGMWLSLGFAALALPLFLFSAPILSVMGQEPEVARIGGEYLSVIGFGLAPALLVMVMKSYLAALGRTQVVLWATVTSVFVNIGVNWLLIFGNLGLPEMGAKGAATASVVVQIFTLLALTLYAVTLPSLRHYQLLVRFWRPDWSALRQVNALGLPIGLALLAETGLFGASAVMMGWFGKEALAAHSIALEITAIFFMVHLGLSNAATVLVGRAKGVGDTVALKASAQAAVVLSLGFACATMLVYWFAAEPMVSLFIRPDEPARDVIVGLGVTLLMVAALFQLADGGQAMAMGLLRGIHDTRQPMIIAAISYWLVGLPAGYGLGFVAGLQGVGVWLGLVAGLTTAAIALHARFWRAV
ncbi:MAG: MATE family efflux transporter [Rhodobacteraceae bacterium]|nr:MATE family efflux transporter [Paracoccaceae bacterium]